MADAKPRKRRVWRILGYAYLACLAVVVVFAFHESRVRLCRECRSEQTHTLAGLSAGPFGEWVVHEGFTEVRDPVIERFSGNHLHPPEAMRDARTRRIALFSFRIDETDGRSGFAEEIRASPKFGELLAAKLEERALTQDEVRALIAFEGFTAAWPDTQEHRGVLRRGTEVVAEFRAVNPRTVQLWSGIDVWASPASR